MEVLAKQEGTEDRSEGRNIGDHKGACVCRYAQTQSCCTHKAGNAGHMCTVHLLLHIPSRVHADGSRKVCAHRISFGYSSKNLVSCEAISRHYEYGHKFPIISSCSFWFQLV